MTGQRRQLREKKKAKTKNFGIFAKIFLPLILLSGVLIFFLLNTKYWNGKDKFIFVSRLADGGAEVTVLDPKLDEEINLIIPGETEVLVARNLGTLQLKNVWQLGINEKLGGRLTAETISQNFLFPVFLWRDPSVKISNIPLGDVLLTKIFLLGVKPINKTEVNLGKSQFLIKVRLNDGTNGYRLTGPVPGALTSFFSDNDFGSRAIRIGITDATGRMGVAQKVGEITEVMGGKVVSIDKKGTLPEIDCFVSGKDPKVVRKIANLFSCKVQNQKTDFDVEIKLGEKFSKRF
jgi:hypothetical protein